MCEGLALSHSIVVVLADRHSTFAEEKAMTKGKEEKERGRERALEQLSSRYSDAEFTAARSACSLRPSSFRFHGPAEPKPKPNR